MDKYSALKKAVQQMHRRRLRRRVVALLAVFTVLLTSNQLKRLADTLEHIPTCNIPEHIHVEACLDDDGALICGMEEHAHTDACYQERPAEDDALEGPVAEREAFSLEDETVLEAPVPEIAGEAFEDLSALMPADASEPEYLYDFNGNSHALLSEILALSGTGLDIGAVESVGESIVSDDQALSVCAVALDGDYDIIPLRCFIDDDRVELAVFTNDGDAWVIDLENGIEPEPVAAGESAGDPIEAPRTEFEESVDEADGDAVVETDEEANEAPAADGSEEIDGETNEEIGEEPTEETNDEIIGEVTEEEPGESSEEPTEEMTGEEPGEPTEEPTEEVTEEEPGEPTEEPTEEVTAEESEETLLEEDAALEADNAIAAERQTFYLDVDLTGMPVPVMLSELIGLPAPETDTPAEAEDCDGLEIVYDPVGPELPGEGEEDIAFEAEAGDAPEDREAEVPSDVPAAWSVTWDEALLDVAMDGGDYRITPLADFESTTVTVVAGGTYVLNLSNRSAAYPAQTFEASVDGVAVRAVAEAGAFPEGTAMSVIPVEDEATLNGLAGAVENGEVAVRRIHAVNITFTDPEGGEIEPLRPIAVSMSVEALAADQSAVVVHMDDNGETSVVSQQAEDAECDALEDPVEEIDPEGVDLEDVLADEAAAEDAAIEAVMYAAPAEGETVVAFEADTFSVYALLVTESLETRYMSTSGETWTIRLTCGPEARIPAGAELVVSEIEPDTDAWRACCANAAAVMDSQGAIGFARFFDIEIQLNGQKIEPAAPVQVTIAYEDALDIPEDATLSVVHFGDDGTEVINDLSLNAEGNEITYSQASFSVTGTVVQNPGLNWNEEKQYALIAEYNGKYYIVMNDGTLKETLDYDAANGRLNTVEVEQAMEWTWRRFSSNNTFLYHTTNAIQFDGYQLPTQVTLEYIDPTTANGLSQEKANWVNNNWTPVAHTSAAIEYDNQRHIIHSLSQTGKYLYITGTEGHYHIAGGTDFWGDAVNSLPRFYMAECNEVSPVGPRYHTVNHIDISIKGSAQLSYPLEPGVYKTADGTVTVPPNTVLTMKKPVDVNVDDIKRANIQAFTRYGNEVKEVDDAFVVTGYTGNESNWLSTKQVRIEGVFKVADIKDGETYNNVCINPYDPGSLLWNQSENDAWRYGRKDDAVFKYIRNERQRRRIYYTLSTTKSVSFTLQYDGKTLKNDDGSDMTVTIPVTLSATFDYWDEDNECPPVHWQDGKEEEAWEDGCIIGDGGRASSGMDFKLGGDESEVAIQIMKYVVDEDGNRIRTDKAQTNEFILYQKPATGTAWVGGKEKRLVTLSDANTVVGLDYTQPFNYGEGYSPIVKKELTVGEEGWAMSYDFGFDPGMVYVQEDPDSIAREIEDKSGNKMTYTRTYMETEYVRRWPKEPAHSEPNHRTVDFTHEDDETGYRSIPEAIGYFQYNNSSGGTENDLNSFLEFYVYNVYAPKTYPVEILKVDAAEATRTLQGAKFDLYGPYTDAEVGAADFDPEQEDRKMNEEAIETGQDGKARIGDLKQGRYFLVETVAPPGYVKLADPIEITVDYSKEKDATGPVSYVQTINGEQTNRSKSGGVTASDPDEDTGVITYTLTVENTAGARLPNTGGPGTAAFTACGGLMIALAALLLLRRRRDA